MANDDAPSAIRIAVHGATGRMGRVLTHVIDRAEDMALVATMSRRSRRALQPNGVDDAREHDDIDSLLKDACPDVVIDFSVSDAVVPLAAAAARHGVHLVTGTSGLSPSDRDGLSRIASESGIGIMVGPNFSLGAAVLERAVAEAGRHFDHAEIIEMHHAGKADAPSGSAMATARAMLDARGGRAFQNAEPRALNVAGVRGGDIGGVAVHSVRMPGLMAHQQVILGGPGETLTLRHDVIDRESYMPGVLLAARAVRSRPGLTYGLGALLWPEQPE